MFPSSDLYLAFLLLVLILALFFPNGNLTLFFYMASAIALFSSVLVGLEEKVF